MKNIPKEWLILVIISVLLVFVGVSEWRKNPPVTTSNTTVSNNQNNKLEKEEGNVTVLIEYLPEKSNNNMVFQISLDTHSVNLDAFDFQKDIRLEKNGKSNLPITVKESGGGHHRKAEVTFAKTAAPITIVVANVSNIPRREFKFTTL